MRLTDALCFGLVEVILRPLGGDKSGNRTSDTVLILAPLVPENRGDEGDARLITVDVIGVGTHGGDEVVLFDHRVIDVVHKGSMRALAS